MNLYPLRIIYYNYTDKDVAINHHQALFVVPKKKCKSAVLRNKLKRRMREAHRQSKHLLAMSANASTYFLMGYIYMGHYEAGDFATVQKQVRKALVLLSGLQS